MQIDLKQLIQIDESYATEIRTAQREVYRLAQEFLADLESAAKLDDLNLAFTRLAEVDSKRQRMASARVQGFDAAKAGRVKTENPHGAGALEEQLFWYKGWCQANNLMPFTEVPMVELFRL